MASRALPPPQKKSRQAAPTTILALGDDLLREVFLRLPSLPSLVRAAIASPAFLRAVRSSPAFRRRFRELHSPTILGSFLVDDEPPMPTFVPVRCSDPDHAAALRGLDVFLTRLPGDIADKTDDGEDAEDKDEEDAKDKAGEDAEDEVEEDTEDEDEDTEDEDEEDAQDEDEDEVEEDTEDEDGEEENYSRHRWSMWGCEEDTEDEDDDGPEWYMSGCRDGYVVLVRPRWNTKKVAVYDPLAGALHLFPAPPDAVFSGDPEGAAAEYHVIPSEADDRSFRVLCVPKEYGGKKIAVLSPDTREWQILPAPGRLKDEDNIVLVKNGLVYWACPDKEDYTPVLNTATLQFSQIDLETRNYSGVYGETNDGKLCCVGAYGDGLEIRVSVRRAGKDGVEKWKRDREFRVVDAIDKLALDITDECPHLKVVAIIGGFAYLSIHQNEPPNWLLSFCLETRELKKLCRITSSEFCYPYIVAWPPSFVRN